MSVLRYLFTLVLISTIVASGVLVTTATDVIGTKTTHQDGREAPSYAPGDEVVGARTRTSKTHWLGGDKYSLDVSLGSIHYLKNSLWAEIDPVLLPTAAPYYRQMTDANYQVYVMQYFNAGQIAKFSKGGQSVEFQPMALELINPLGMIQPVAMPKAVTPIVSHEIIDNYLPGYSPHVGKIEWLDAYGPNIHFEWQTTNTRLNKIITVSGLNDLPSPEPYLGDNVSLRFNMIFAPTAGLDVFVDGVLWDKKTKVQTFDHIYFIDQNDTVLWSFAPLLYWDSSNNPETGQGQSIAALEKRGNKLYISVLVPYEWLQTATFPVFIDVDVDEQVGASTDDGREYTINHTMILTETISPQGKSNITALYPPDPFTLTDLGITLIDLGASSIGAEWTPDATATYTMIRISRSGYPSSITDGELFYYGDAIAYNGTGYDLEYMTYYASAWGFAADNVTYSADYTTASVGGGEMIYLALGMMSTGLLIAMMGTKQMMLGFPAALLWFILGGYSYTQSSIPWGDWQYYLFFASMGIGIFSMFAAYALRTKKEEAEEGDLYFDEDGDKDVKFIDEGGKNNDTESDGEKPSRKIRGIRERAAQRRSRWE